METCRMAKRQKAARARTEKTAQTPAAISQSEAWK